ncbi:hypothetical protein DLAC_09301 [Tieghemostelium lacteum]|uniref:EGF-like domain-containing protein n=1 Tax=Tieghemostelium lacteum TaxID=361077 RepID=A0A151Z9P4_TIELA|nr:hypothetical protein DLAC_09301 [Tieghemostelium lacteum]|eukprot:KYQ90666.1 hypothetical protein DLAC_09301 [Tieghemostelium lacteum]
MYIKSSSFQITFILLLLFNVISIVTGEWSEKIIIKSVKPELMFVNPQWIYMVADDYQSIYIYDRSNFTLNSTLKRGVSTIQPTVADTPNTSNNVGNITSIYVTKYQTIYIMVNGQSLERYNKVIDKFDSVLQLNSIPVPGIQRILSMIVHEHINQLILSCSVGQQLEKENEFGELEKTNITSGLVLVMSLSDPSSTSLTKIVGQGILKSPLKISINYQRDILYVLDSPNSVFRFHTNNQTLVDTYSFVNSTVLGSEGSSQSIVSIGNSQSFFYMMTREYIVAFNDIEIARYLNISKSLQLIEMVASQYGVFVLTSRDVRFYQWIGPIISNVYYSYNRVNIDGYRLLSTNLVTIDGKECLQLFKLNDNHVYCKLSPETHSMSGSLRVLIYSTRAQQLQQQRVTNSFSTLNYTIQESKLVYTQDGCLYDYFYDTQNDVCKKLKYTHLKVFKCSNGSHTVSRIESGIIKDTDYECPFKLTLLSSKLIDIEHFRYLHYQTCWNVNELTIDTEIYTGVTSNLPPNSTTSYLTPQMIEYLSKLKRSNTLPLKSISSGGSTSTGNMGQDGVCESSYSAPIFMDLSTSLKLYQYSCFNLFGSEDRIQANYPARIDHKTCQMQSEFIQDLDIWKLSQDRCLHGQRVGDSCVCQNQYKGDNCDTPICSLKNTVYSVLEKKCQCNLTCPPSEVLEESLCICMCPLKTPFRCGGLDGPCVSSSIYCNNNTNSIINNKNNTLSNTAQSIVKQKCNDTHPYQCSSGSCEETPNLCKSKVLECLVSNCCWNGRILSNKSDQSLCPILPKCPSSMPFRCPDSSCKVSSQSCTIISNPACQNNVICPDQTCPPCQEYDGCYPNQIQCQSGECRGNQSLCFLPSFIKSAEETTKISKLSQMFNKLLPVYTKPQITLQTIPYGQPKEMLVYNVKNKLLAKIDLMIPEGTNTTHNNFTLLTVKPIADSYIRKVAFQNDQFSREHNILTSVLNITITPGYPEDQVFPFIVNITFVLNSDSELANNQTDLSDVCLGFINTTLNQWECVKFHDKNQLKFNHLNRISSNKIQGYTNHFTSFALLLVPKKSKSGHTTSTSTDESQDPQNSSEHGLLGGINTNFNLPKEVVLVTVCTIVAVVIIICIGTTVYFSYQKHGKSFKNMKDIYKERFKYSISKISFSIGTTSNNSNISSTETTQNNNSSNVC